MRRYIKKKFPQFRDLHPIVALLSLLLRSNVSFSLSRFHRSIRNWNLGWPWGPRASASRLSRRSEMFIFREVRERGAVCVICLFIDTRVRALVARGFRRRSVDDGIEEFEVAVKDAAREATGGGQNWLETRKRKTGRARYPEPLLRSLSREHE